MKFLALFLLFIVTITFAEGNFGGSHGKYISGNIVTDFSYNSNDSILYVLTSSGLSYAKVLSSDNHELEWYNFSSEFGSRLAFQAIFATDTMLFLVGAYTDELGNYRGGNTYYKSKGESDFRSYYPALQDSFRLCPINIDIVDSTVYIPFYNGTYLKSSLNNLDSAKAMLLQADDFNSHIYYNDTFSISFKKLIDTINYFYNVANLTDSIFADSLAFQNTISDALFDSISKTVSYYSHIKRYADTISFSLKYGYYKIDSLKSSRDYFQVDTFSIATTISIFDSLMKALVDTQLTTIADTMGKYSSEIKTRYEDSLLYEIDAPNYPPKEYRYLNKLFVLNSAGTKDLLLLGTTSGLRSTSDSGRSYIELLSANNSVVHIDGIVPSIYQCKIRKSTQDSFRVFIIDNNYRVAYSSNVLNLDRDLLSGNYMHLDSLKKWHFLMDSTETVQFNSDSLQTSDKRLSKTAEDIDFFNDTIFVVNNDYLGISKYYKSSDSLTYFIKDSIPLTGFLEPHLGANTIQIVPIDSLRYDLWAGSDMGLYRLQYGHTVWELFEYKRPLESIHGETYAYPTVIRQGGKSSKIAYKLDKSSNVTIEIYDFSMRKVKTIIKDQFRKMSTLRSDLSTEDRWDGTDNYGRFVSAGIYYYKIKAENKVMFGKIVVFSAKNAN